MPERSDLRNPPLMPAMDGWAVLAALKEHPALAPTPVILVTVDEAGARGCAVGAVDFLTKPIDRERLIDLIHSHALTSRPGSVLIIATTTTHGR